MTRIQSTQTSKSILTNEEAWDLTNRLRAALRHDLYFAQALYQLATPTDIDVLEALIGTVKHLVSEPMSELEDRTRHYMHSTDQSMKGNRAASGEMKTEG